MSYIPIAPMGGYSGWLVLNRTMERQQAAFSSTGEFKRTEEYFKEKIGNISTAAELVSDRRLLSVALGAFGLDDDINNKFFIQKVLEEGTLDEKSLASRLSDKSYFKLSEAFGFGDFDSPRTTLENFSDEIMEKYRMRQFEIAVGETDESFRFAMYAQRELPELAGKDSSVNSKWYSIIASEPLSAFMQKALGLPNSVSSLNVDQQVEVYKNKSLSVFGDDNVSEIVLKNGVDEMVKRYLINSSISGSNSITGSSVALQILKGRSATSGVSIIL